MQPQELEQRLSRISTLWSDVLQAHRASSSSAAAARADLLERYTGAVFRYLLGAVRDAEAAEELSQEFIVKFLRGDFHRAAPERGRFRDYIKTSLINLVNSYFRSRQKGPRSLESAALDPAAAATDDPEDSGDFENCWREELLERTWAALNSVRPNYYAVLRLRVENPDMAASEMAEHLESPMTPAAIRKTLERARTKFADLLVDEVATSISSTDIAPLEAELKELDLLRHCGSALGRRK